jgi:epoxyqueuosine reductase QueG
MSHTGYRQDRKPCPCCHLAKPMLDGTMLTGSWYCTRCGLRGPWNDSTGYKWDSLPRQIVAKLLLTVPEAAQALGVSERHIKRLIAEADANRKSSWRWGRELINLAPINAQRRMIRVNVGAVVPGTSQIQTIAGVTP